MNTVNLIGYLVMVSWYPGLWVTWIVVSLWAFTEEALPHDQASGRAMLSQSLAEFLIEDKVSAVSVGALYLLSWVLVLTIPTTAAIIVMMIICLITIALIMILSDF